MTMLIRRVVLLVLLAFILFAVKKRKPVSWIRILGPIFIVPMMGLIWDYIYELFMLVLDVRDGVILSAVYAALRMAIEVVMISACLFIYQGFSGDYDDLFPCFLAQPKWANITLVLIVILCGVLNFYNDLSLLEFMHALTSYDAPDNYSMLSIITRLNTPSLSSTLCAHMSVAVVGVEAIVCVKQLSKAK